MHGELFRFIGLVKVLGVVLVCFLVFFILMCSNKRDGWLSVVCDCVHPLEHYISRNNCTGRIDERVSGGEEEERRRRTRSPPYWWCNQPNIQQNTSPIIHNRPHHPSKLADLSRSFLLCLRLETKQNALALYPPPICYIFLF